MRIGVFPGGGMRGLISATWVGMLEERLNCHLGTRLDMVAGNSTGAFIAAGLASGISGERLADFYVTHGPKIFARSPWKWLRSFWRPRYDQEPVRRALHEVFGGKTMGELGLPTLVVCYDALDREARVVKSWHDTHRNLPIWRVLLASSAAPTYFPPSRLLGGLKLDGGLEANDPTMCAVAEAVRLGAGLDEIEIFCFGTGRQVRPIQKAERYGLIGWARWLPSFVTGQSVVEYQARQLLGERYQLMQCELRGASDDMDDARPKNVKGLRDLARRYAFFGQGEEILVRMAKRLST